MLQMKSLPLEAYLKCHARSVKSSKLISILILIFILIFIIFLLHTPKKESTCHPASTKSYHIFHHLAQKKKYARFPWHPAQRGNMDLQRRRCALPPPSSHYNTVQVLDDHHDTSIWYNCSWYKHIIYIYIYITASKIIIGIINHNHDFRYLLLPAVTKQDHSISLDWPFCSRILAIRSWLLHHLEDPLLRTRLRLSSGGKKPIIFACWCFFGCKWHFELEIL